MIILRSWGIHVNIQYLFYDSTWTTENSKDRIEREIYSRRNWSWRANSLNVLQKANQILCPSVCDCANLSLGLTVGCKIGLYTCFSRGSVEKCNERGYSLQWRRYALEGWWERLFCLLFWLFGLLGLHSTRSGSRSRLCPSAFSKTCWACASGSWFFEHNWECQCSTHCYKGQEDYFNLWNHDVAYIFSGDHNVFQNFGWL